MSPSNLWDVLSALAWPVVLAALLFFYRHKLTELVDAFTAKFQTASHIKLGTVELKGPLVDPSEEGGVSAGDGLPFDGNEYSRVRATKKDMDARDAIYDSTRSLMLAHRIRPSKNPGQKYDISIFLVRKFSKNQTTARFNDVDHVEYYLGKWFGGKAYGSKYVVRTSDNGFAMTTSAYGSPLCVAKIHFHDGTMAETSRYLDFEMAPVFGEREENGEKT